MLMPGRSTSAMNFRWNFRSFNKIFLAPAPLGTVVWREIPGGSDQEFLNLDFFLPPG